MNGQIVPRTNAEVPNFTVQGPNKILARAVLEWRGRPHEFWAFHVSDDGPFHEKQEVTLDQARAIKAAVEELDMRLAGYSFHSSGRNVETEGVCPCERAGKAVHHEGCLYHPKWATKTEAKP